MLKKKFVVITMTVAMASGSIFASPVLASAGDNSLSKADESTVSTPLAFAESTVSMYRLYNPNSSEHFYTSSESEKNNLIKAGWQDEGVGWIAPSTSKTPVYRLYNPNSGDHHYTTNVGERNNLVKAGWKDEGIGWYSSDEKKIAVYRQYNPNAKKAGAHNYTTSKAENDTLVKAGWRAEGIGWYASGEGKTKTAAAPAKTASQQTTTKPTTANTSTHKYPTLKEVGITGARYTDQLNAKVDKALDDLMSIIRENKYDPSKFTDYDKAYAVLNYVANYNYGSGTTAEQMLDKGTGTCTAYTDLIYCMARKWGLINTWPCVMGRPVDHQGPDGMYQVNGEQHQLCVTLINGKYYALDGNRAWLVWVTAGVEIKPEEITESYARYLLGQTKTYTKVNP